MQGKQTRTFTDTAHNVLFWEEKQHVRNSDVDACRTYADRLADWLSCSSIFVLYLNSCKPCVYVSQYKMIEQYQMVGCCGWGVCPHRSGEGRLVPGVSLKHLTSKIFSALINKSRVSFQRVLGISEWRPLDCRALLNWVYWVWYGGVFIRYRIHKSYTSLYCCKNWIDRLNIHRFIMCLCLWVYKMYDYLHWQYY